jgi:hypothetical protein
MPAKISSISKQDSFVLVNHAKIPVVAFGPMMIEHGIGAPHNPDECLDIDEAWQGCQVAYSTICRWLQYHDKQKVAKSQIIALERSSKTSGDFTKVSLLKN